MLSGVGLWSSFGGRFGHQSVIDEILDRPHFTLQDLLDNEEIIQECKYLNSQLIEFLSNKNTIQKLVKYIVAQPKSNNNNNDNNENKENQKKDKNKMKNKTGKKKNKNKNDSSSNSPSKDFSSDDKKSSNGSSSLSPSSHPLSSPLDIPSNSSSSSSSDSPTLDPLSTSPPSDSKSSSSSSVSSPPSSTSPLSDSLLSTSPPLAPSAPKSESDSEQSDEVTNDDGDEDDDDDDGNNSNNPSSSNPNNNDDNDELLPHELKYPYISSELFACEIPQMLDVLFNYWSLLDLLFSILDRPAPLDPSTVGYFRKVIQVLIQRKYQPLVEYCSRRGVVEKLVRHIGLYSIMELLIMLGWDDGLGQPIDQGWLIQEDLIPKLVNCLHPKYQHLPDVHTNAGRALVDVVVKCPPQDTSPLVHHLTTTETLQQIFQHMFSGSFSSLSNCLSVIIVLVQRFANRRIQFDGENYSEPSTLLGNPDEPDSIEGLEEPFISLMPHLPKIFEILTFNHTPPELKNNENQAENSNKPSSSSSSVSSPTHTPVYNVPLNDSNPGTIIGPLQSSAFGSLRMKVVELCLVLSRSRILPVDRALVRLNVLPVIIDVFFEYPWNNLLHGLVESIVMSALDQPLSPLAKNIFYEGKFIEKIIQAYEKNEECISKGKQRMGYMGHLIRTAISMEQILQRVPEFKAELFVDDVNNPDVNIPTNENYVESEKSVLWMSFLNSYVASDLERQRPAHEFQLGISSQESNDLLQQDLNLNLSTNDQLQQMSLQMQMNNMQFDMNSLNISNYTDNTDNQNNQNNENNNQNDNEDESHNKDSHDDDNHHSFVSSSSSGMDQDQYNDENNRNDNNNHKDMDIETNTRMDDVQTES